MRPEYNRDEDIASIIAARILTVVRPWRIVLFGSRARGDAKEHSDYDVYVEVDPGTATLKQIHSDLYNLCAGTGTHVDVKVHEPGTIERRRNDPGTIEWDVAREGRVLYAHPDASTSLTPTGRVREARDGDTQPAESLAEWLETARRDLRLCQRLLQEPDGFWPDVCWYSHQTSEKHLKALLVSHRVRPHRTHDLTGLLTALRQAGCEMPGIDDDCQLVSKHATTPRYPAGNDLGEDDGRAAYAAAERIVAGVERDLPRRLH
jgi:HEPN domain-containing protein/predicted nucleotidyltransferase